MCQMCEEYEAELRRMGIAMDRETPQASGERAREHGHIVRSTVAGQRMTPGEFEQRASAIAAMTPEGVEQAESAQLIREDRDSR